MNNLNKQFSKMSIEDNLINEINNKFSKMSIDEMDNLINRMENLNIKNKKDKDIDNLVDSMKSLNLVSSNKKKAIMLNGMKKYKRRIFARTYKNLSGKKTELTKTQIDDIFATMDKLKNERKIQNGGRYKYKK